MMSRKTLQDEHFSSIKNNKTAVISRVMELSTVTFPLLTAYYLYLRKQNSIHNKIDEKNETAKMIQEYNYACAHNLLFFLTVTHQFNLIREIFQNNEKCSLLMALIDEIEKEQKQAQAQRNLILETNQKVLLREQAKQSEPQSQSSSGSMNALLMYEYYDLLHKNITYKHCVALIDIYDKAYNRRMGRMDDACDAVLNNPSVSLADKKALVDMRREYRKEHEQIKSMRITHQDGSPHFEAAEKQAALLSDLDNRYNKKFESYLNDLLAKPNTDLALKEKLKTTLKTEHEDKQRTQEHVENEKERYQGEVTEVVVLSQSARQEATNLVGTLIQDINDVSMKKIPEHQQEEYTQLTARLNNMHEHLKHVDSPARQKELLHECTSTLNRVKGIVEPAMDIETQQTFNHNLNLLHQLIKDADVSKHYTASRTVDIPIQEGVSVFNAKEPHRASNESSDIKLPEKINGNNPYSLFSLKSESPSQTEHVSTQPHEIHLQSSSAAIELQRKIKMGLQENRPHQSHPSAVLDFPHQKEMLLETTGGLISKLKDDMRYNEFSEQDIEDYERLCTMHAQLEQESCSKEHCEHLVFKILSSAERLSENHESIEEINSQLNDITQKINSSDGYTEHQSLGN